jgi:rubredoxin
MGKIVCPNCGYSFEESTGSSFGKTALAYGAGITAGFLVGGPLGGAVGGYLGACISRAIRSGTKDMVSGIVNQCPRCGTDVKTGNNWFHAK